MHIICPHCHNPIEVVKITPREEIACPSCGSSFSVETGATTGSEGSAGWKVGRFDLIETVGHGGFGTVYKARDPELDRVVAIKVPRTGNLAGPQELDRFLREARSVAQLRHPSIVSIHEVGQQDGVPYLVSDFVKGVTLADLLSARRPGFREAAEMVAAVADALQYAHERGVVHRDVKPSNIMIGEDGTPCVMDFGLAKREAGEITMTVEGQVLGTPAYMPPEQARGEGHAVDARGDVYSLGVVLYELLTGELPFRGTKRMLLHQVLHDEPRPPRSLNDHIPRDLETITLKTMAKEPGRRYATARELADDLRRWLKGEPIQARPVGRIERVARWARRRPAVAALMMMSGIAALALVGLGVGLYFNAELDKAFQAEAAAHTKAEEARSAEEEQRKTAEAARSQAEEAKKNEEAQRRIAEAAVARADQIAYFHSIFLADLALKENNLPLAQERLKECKPELRNWEWRYLDAQCQSELFSFPGVIATFSPDGTHIAALDRPGEVRVYDARTGREVLHLKALAGIPSFSPDGARIAARGNDGGMRVYDARTGQEALALRAPAGLKVPDRGLDFFPFLVFSPDGARLAVYWGDEMVRVYDARTGQEALALKATAPHPSLFSPDGARLAVGDPNGVVRVYDARTGQELLLLKAAAELGLPAFSPDGARIATCMGADGVVRVYDAWTGQEAFAVKAPHGEVPVFSPDGARLAVGDFQLHVRDREGVVRVYDARTGQEVLTLKAPAKLHAPAFTPDGTRIAAGGADGVVRVYDARTGQETLALKTPTRPTSPVLSPDGARIATIGTDGVVRVYDARTGQEALLLKQASHPVFSPDGARIAIASSGGGVAVRDVQTGKVSKIIILDKEQLGGGVAVRDVLTGQEILAFRVEAWTANKPAFSPDWARIAFEGTDGVVRVYDARNGQKTLQLKGSAALDTPVFSPDGSRIATSSFIRGMVSTPEGFKPPNPQGDGVVRVYDARNGQEVLALKAPAGGVPVFSPDGARIAAWSRDGGAHVYDGRTGQEILTLKGPGGLATPVFSPDGAGIAARGNDGGVHVYDSQNGQETLALRGSLGFFGPVFSPDGTRIAAVGMDRVARVYDSRAGQDAFALKAPAGLSLLQFSPDGARIAAWGMDEVVRIHDARTGQETLALKNAAGTRPPNMAFSPGPIVFSPDGARIAVEVNDDSDGRGVVQMWTAPDNITAWQAKRRTAVADSLPAWYRAQAHDAWYRAQADELERSGEWSGEWYAAAFHLGRLIDVKQASGLHHYRRGWAFARLTRTTDADKEFAKALALKDDLPEQEQADAHGMLGQWDAAGKFYAKATEAPGAGSDVYSRHALLRLALDDRTGYATACAAIVQHFGKSKSASETNRVAWTCALGPGALRELQPAVDAARMAVQATAKDSNVRNTLGAILHRAGQQAESVKELNESIRLNPAGGRPLDFLFLAMAHHRLGKPAEARTWLEKATQAHAKQPPVSWPDRLYWELLHREAEALLREPPPEPKK